MFKNIIAPVQAWLLSQGRCVGCGTPLSEGRKDNKSNNEERIICKKCNRIFIRDLKTNRFRRAPLSQVK